ncbi:Outer membrane usher protein fimD Flags: Precursor [Salmonella enterica subsp. enterica]|uniref:StdB_2 protein n=1 Tax=Salmonella enterica I TaxID=59201 RepID=A0A379WLT8_SALET|nr:Outer membrane usher protein fimD Flags: Precursor [Salmonella enterica subsp. enterica]
MSAGSSYRRSDISVDVAALPEDVDVSSSVISQVLTEGAVGYRKIDASQGSRYSVISGWLMAPVRRLAPW